MPYRPCVGVALFNREGRVFVGRRRPDKGPEYRDPVFEWQMPQGGIDPGEDPYTAALRELYEETNIRSTALLAEAPEWYRYDLPLDALGKALKGRYRGQTQKWFALRFTGDEAEIDVRAPGGGHHKPEFVDWRWERLENLPDLIIPFKRGVYEQVVRAFAPLVAAE
ncbi:MAG: RNA pyrophosphohydrolase [Hyphomicrobiales bacterium]|uniref:RNA pyrophosphohydrolase n=1 Tax=Rhabdaerophilum calidifontis TaxID=2604328 RepID=UPI00123B499B|nr:RNA pyrophosphohydrolase [Rhabdaerophilum calidifontis]MCA1952570.1 RNA pyrophosphohydrolase [Hyphomicrobiales bacterium]MCA1998696.1 RNA pyrophosphohydrolase [Hyphomicrobiales bacterium]